MSQTTTTPTIIQVHAPLELGLCRLHLKETIIRSLATQSAGEILFSSSVDFFHEKINHLKMKILNVDKSIDNMLAEVSALS